MRLAVLLVVVLGLTGCSGRPSPGGPTTTTDEVDPRGGATDASACAGDHDCVVSCAVPDQCCDAQLCEPCEQVYTVAELDAIDAWKAQACATATCPVARCMAPTERAVARCNAGQCAIQRVPFPRD